MHLGYHTSGLLHHRLIEAIELLAEIGYEGVAITIDHARLDPFDPDLQGQLPNVRDCLASNGMRSVVETGAPFLLDARLRHEPTLVSEDATERMRRVAFLQRSIEIAASLGSDCVSFWSGSPQIQAADSELLQRMAEGLEAITRHAGEHGVKLGLEPKPGMCIDTMGRYERLLRWFQSPHLGLTLDVGTLYCQGEVPIGDYIRRYRQDVVNVHLADRRAGSHEPLMFGEGEMDFRPILRTLRECGYAGGLYVELSKHSDHAPDIAQASFDFLHPMLATMVS